MDLEGQQVGITTAFAVCEKGVSPIPKQMESWAKSNLLSISTDQYFARLLDPEENFGITFGVFRKIPKYIVSRKPEQKTKKTGSDKKELWVR